MLGQCPLDKFIFKIRVLLNKAVEFALICLSCSPVTALSSGSRHCSRKIRFFFTNGKRKNALKHRVRLYHLMGDRRCLPSL